MFIFRARLDGGRKQFLRYRALRTRPSIKQLNSTRLITIFTPSFADENNSNAQNLTVKELVARLPGDKFHVTMICHDEPDPRIASRPNTEFAKWAEHGNALRLLRRCLLAKPDIYFFPRYGPLDRAFFDLRTYVCPNTALVSYIVTTMNENTATALMARSILEAELVCANSAHVAGTIRERFGTESTIIHDGVDRRYYFPRTRKLKSGPLIVLYAGSFRPLKRVEFVIEQAARWPGVEFRLAGMGETEQSCRRMCEQLQCSNVQFLGHLSSEQLGGEMRNADVFLFPSILEGHPQVLIQAAACGLPSVAMNLYRPDAVVDGQTGFLAASDEEFAHGLDLLLRDHETRRRMAAAAVLRALDFDWDRIASKWAELFCEVAGQRPKLGNPQRGTLVDLHT
jgi:glycosyltransferase involved in cell wall biosynthesis